MSKSIEVKEDKVVKHSCNCGYTITGYKLSDGIIPHNSKYITVHLFIITN